MEALYTTPLELVEDFVGRADEVEEDVRRAVDVVTVVFADVIGALLLLLLPVFPEVVTKHWE